MVLPYNILPYNIYRIIIVIIFLFQLIVIVSTIINMVKLNYTRKEKHRLKGKLSYIIHGTAVKVTESRHEDSQN